MPTLSRPSVPSFRRGAALGAAALAGVVGLAACGDDSTKVITSPSTSAASSTTSSGGAAGSSATSAGTGGGSSSSSATTTGGSATTAKSGSSTTAKSSGSGSSGNIGNTFIDAVNAVARGDCAKASDIAKVAGDAADPTKLGGQMSDIAKAMQQLGTSGPSEVRGDFATLGKAFDGIAKIYDQLGLNDPSKLGSAMTDPATLSKLEEASKQFDDAAVTKASENISKWFEAKCPGITKDTSGNG